MSKVDRAIAIAGLALFLLSCLYLPVEIHVSGDTWIALRWHWIGELGKPEYRVDFMRLVLEWLAIAALLAIARLTVSWRK